MLGFFMPSGFACCYHKSGAIHMLCNPHGGLLMDDVSLAIMHTQVTLVHCHFTQDGYTTRKWEWPPVNEKMPHSISLQVARLV